MRSRLVRLRSGDWELLGERLELHHGIGPVGDRLGGSGEVPLALLAHDNCDDDDREDEANRKRNRYGQLTLLGV